ncbi:MAG: hypothetical protein ATN36_05555 [Epulopiscium sp. Nele67-Bin005]|nr:MAG: hypothetical protein ATN36_05555 [Epulopiscium sp. Nele67-Bin005]
MGGSSTGQSVRKLASLPHYFTAQFDKELNMIVQYFISDTKEKGYLTIAKGDCIYTEGVAPEYAVEITLSDKTLQELMSKELSYQRSFMVGKIKVKGNFALLPKLDQIFKK